jgi:hypothetical protein
MIQTVGSINHYALGLAKMKDTEVGKTMLDGLSVITVVGTLVDMLPSIAAVFTILWTGIRIWETDTMQRMLGRKKDAKQEQSPTQSDGDGR